MNDPHPTESLEARLAEADRMHDDTPEPALAILRGIAPAALPLARRARFAFLMNHVAGEKFGLWDEALAAQRTLVEATGVAMTPVLWRHAAVGAHLAGDTRLAAHWLDAFASATQAPVAEVQALVALSAAEFLVPARDAAAAGRLALEVLRPLDGAALAPGLDASLAAAANNLASLLVERPLDDLRQPELRAALELASELALQAWMRAGQWLQQERAHYLRALAANASGDGATGARHARAGLALLDANDTARAEDVDRAFLALELAQGLRLAHDEGAAPAHERAEALAAAFDDESLRAWFADRVQRNAALLALHERARP